MSVEENKALIHRVVEALNSRNWVLAGELTDPNFVDHSPQVPGAALYKDAFPDFQATIEHVIAEGDKVVVRVTVTGTHRGEFMGVPPTNKRVSWTSIIIYRIVNGKAGER